MFIIQMVIQMNFITFNVYRLLQHDGVQQDGYTK